jgi:N-formylglutamate amidohydrolase
MVLHLPHASPLIPSEARRRFTVDDRELEAEILRSTDWYTDELFAYAEAIAVVFPISRLVVDPERFEVDGAELMSKVGRGVIYQSCTDGTSLRTAPSVEERESLLSSYYRPHHRRLEEAVELELSRRGSALILDAHSFPDFPWQVEPCQNPVRPDFCIGTDPFHTPPELTAVAKDFLTGAGFGVALNQPYGGTIIPARHYRRQSSVQGLMIEVNRRLYLDEASGIRSGNFAGIRDVIRKLCGRLDAWHSSQHVTGSTAY